MNVNKAKAFAAFNNFADSRVKLIADLRDAGYTVETARPVCIEWACSKTGCKFSVNENTGRVTLASAHKKYETTKTIVRDMMSMVEGTTRREKAGMSAKREPVAVDAKLVKSVRAEIIAAGLTKKQLDALIAELRATISFA